MGASEGYFRPTVTSPRKPGSTRSELVTLRRVWSSVSVTARLSGSESWGHDGGARGQGRGRSDGGARSGDGQVTGATLVEGRSLGHAEGGMEIFGGEERIVKSSKVRG